MERLFQIVAAILAGVAVFFLWQGNKDGTFIATVFSAVCFFLSVRFQIKDRLKKREAEDAESGESDESEKIPEGEIK